MEQQVATILDVAEIDSQWATVSNGGTDGLVVEIAISEPNLASTAQTYALVDFVDVPQFHIVSQLFSRHVNAAARQRSDRTKSFLVRGIVRDNSNSSI